MGCIVKSYKKSIIRIILSTLAVSFIVSFYYSSYIIVDRYIHRIEQNITITAVMNEDVPEDSLKPALKNIKSLYWVKEARLIKPDSGLTKIDRNIGGISEDLLPDNPLPTLINVTIKAEYLNSFNLAKYNLLIKRIDGVENTLLRKDYAETVFSIKNQFNVLAIIIGILLGLIVLLIIFLSLIPEFVKSKATVIFSAGIKDYSQTAKEIFYLLTIVVLGSIIIASGLLYLLLYLIKAELLWYMNVPWQILLWNLSFVLIAFELVFLMLYLIYKPKKSITDYELRPDDKAQGNMITNELAPNVPIVNEEGDSSTTIRTTEEGEIDSTITQDTTVETNNTPASWEDDIT
ncbi:MAG: hypothetical protein A2X61_06070 [Ignavibacteria bacterium GWB2_35_12]|nr:MAG: hypothetical protein A2X63_13865 [Ignavibacteria bacterium GWA2_35_8]OGU39820.1 MAG: hypothetical protein A2X61_06070 [Ignavibacteria bacterium GWB2_35_12]OGU90018.1 MAG: hypothetical protein A2220_05230 [Ignavibacteria bacterium RIFOXYA2_FULL_35_10]OGV21450.1 MAG: hypothetical protein A2475_13650 [Ignavibacteria bacterium RIFOXYC2_FULL_35_21]